MLILVGYLGRHGIREGEELRVVVRELSEEL